MSFFGGSTMGYAINDGYLDSYVRGLRVGLLTVNEYQNLTQCEKLDDVRMQISASSYGNILQNDPSPLSIGVISQRCLEKLVKQFNFVRMQAVKPLHTFMNYITYGYMIDNIVLILMGTIYGRNTQEQLKKCHPLGMFPALASLAAAQSTADLYNIVLAETPLAKYFRQSLSQQDLSEMSIELVRNTLYKAYLEDFYAFTQTLDDTTAEVMKEIIEFEADRRAITITINSFGTELSRYDRQQLYPQVGKLYPAGTRMLGECTDLDQVKGVASQYETYRRVFAEIDETTNKTLDDAFFEHEVKLNKASFSKMFNYGAFYSYVKLKEQEIRNIVWICECIVQNKRNRINDYLPIFVDPTLSHE